MENDGYRLCKEDAKYLKDVAFKAKNSELECVEEDEFKSHKRELLLGLGADESKNFLRNLSKPPIRSLNL